MTKKLRVATWQGCGLAGRTLGSERRDIRFIDDCRNNAPVRWRSCGFDVLDLVRRLGGDGRFDHGLSRLADCGRFDDDFSGLSGDGRFDHRFDHRLDHDTRLSKIIERLRNASYQSLEIHRLGPHGLIRTGTAGAGSAHSFELPAALAFRRLRPCPRAKDFERCQRRMLLTATSPPYDRADEQRDPYDDKACRRKEDQSLVRRIVEIAADDDSQDAASGQGGHPTILACRAPRHTPPWAISTAMRQASAVDVLWMILAIGACAGLWYVGYRIEPHHVSKDGTRFLSSGQSISNVGDPDGRRREVWVKVLPGGRLEVDVKRRLRRDVTHWWIEGKAPEPPPRRAVYVLRTVSNLGTTQRMAIKLPAKSRAVAIMDEAMANTRKS